MRLIPGLLAASAIGASLAGFLALPALAQTGGVFTADQATAGQGVFNSQCAQCHGANLEGGVGPSLTGGDFFGNWGTAADVYDYYSVSMPPQAPGKLGDAAYTNILAYLLSFNGFPAGDTTLTNDPAVLSGIVLERQAQAAPAAPAAGAAPASAPAAGATPAAPAAEANPAVPAGMTQATPETTATAGPGATPGAFPVPERMANYAPVTNDMILNPPPEEWLMWRRTLDNQGYSPLDQINGDNVKELQLAWAWPMAEDGQQESAPLVHDGVMFLSTNNNIVQALDAKTGDQIWEYRHIRPEIPASAGYQNNQARRQKNSVALYEDKVIVATVDAKLLALDAKTGQIVWEVQVYDGSLGYSYTVGPIIVNDKIISAISGCSITGTAGGCFITAHNAKTGEEIWRFNTIADPNNPEQEASWGGVPAENRWGGTPWATGSYDPRTNTTFWGVGMPGPYTEIIRGSGDGEVLYTNNTVALDADTGERKWNYSHLPRDNWDLDSPFERVLVDADIGGKEHNLLVTVPGKTGVAFGLERDDGKFLWSRDTVYQNVISNIDQATGKITLNEALIPTEVGQEVLICTSVSGGKLWQAGAYSPLTQSFYVPLAEACNTVAPVTTEFTPGNAIGAVKFGPRVLPEGITNAGVVQAFKVADGANLWRHDQRATFTSSLLTTGGGLVFGGDAGRYLMAMDQVTGEVVWKVRLNAPIGGFPMTYEIDGEQYLAIPTGFSAQAGSSASMFPEIPLPSGSGNSLFVFKLPSAS